MSESDRETTKRKDVDLKNLYNFVGDNIFIYHEKLRLNLSHLKFIFFKRSQMEK
jgi:hypothetical protein